MPDLLVLRLHPSKPMAPSGTNGFRDLLNGLTIKAYDLTFADSVDGVLLGTASGLADPHLPGPGDDSVTIADTQILQHYLDITDITGTYRYLESVATAVIEVTRPAGHTEYPTPSAYDLRLEITNAGGQSIIDQRLDFNVEVSTVPGPLPGDQPSYFALPATSYVTLPSTGAALDPGTAWVDLPADGQPPAFDQLVHAIDLVLASDPGAPHGNLITASPLTPAQARYIANQIVFNRAVNPAPAPDPSLGLDPLGALYTAPKVDQSVNDDDITKDRPRFEAELDGYYGTLESNALRLAGYVYSASAAVAEEVLSSQAGQARLEVPLITGAATPTSQASVGVELVEAGGLSPSFIVPAAYFYALAAVMPSQVGPQQRFDTARLTVEAKLLSDIAVAVDGGVISVPVAPLTAAGAIRPEQAARRLHALGQAETSLVQIPLVAPIETLVGDWLAYTGATASIVADFWQAEVTAHPAAYLELLLQAITRNFTPLVDAIKGAPYHVGTVAELVALTDQQWRDLFLAAQPPPAGPPPRIDLLPPWTLPGTPPERVEAFIRQLRTFFAVTAEVPTSSGAAIGVPPTLPRSAADPFAAFVASYPTHSGGIAFSFGTAPDPGAVTAAVADVFPDDPAAQAWLSQAVTAIGELWTVTDLGAGELQFSLIEALYSRGFTSAAQIAALSPADFQYALTGTVAYPWAVSATAQPSIYTNAGGTGGSGNPPAEQFNPVNPHGSLTDCVPPRELSPLGEFEYLRQLLAVAAGSTCADPLQPGDAASLGQLLAGRRGPLADLHVTAANLDTPLPLIDLVNESLEALVTTVPGSVAGAVYDTAADELAGHLLATEDPVEEADGPGGDPWRHEPRALFGALPEHSSPAAPVAEPGAYEVLRADFSHPDLPYSQPLDLNRSYLGALRTSRFAVMRHFRRDITEFAIDAGHEPADFLAYQWRYPVRLPIALEYLHISPEEYDQLYAHDLVGKKTKGRQLLREVYGFAADTIDDEGWTTIVRRVPEFLRRTGLSYCEFIELWRSGYVSFSRMRSERQQSTAEFDECEPCCLDDLVIDFGDADPAVPLRRLIVFIRLWRSLRALRCEQLSFAELRDIALVLKLFRGHSVNPDFLRQLAALLMLRELLDLPLHRPGAAAAGGATGADSSQLLALWEGPAAGSWSWAVSTLIERVDATADRWEPALTRQPELDKLIVDNLDPLSRLAGFDPDTAGDSWHAQPTSTLRFAEVLLKIYLSDFTVGELLFLFSDVHLDGDDPFGLPSANEAVDAPLELPDDDRHGLAALRRKLLAVEVEDEAVEAWSWTGMVTALVQEFGYQPAASDDPLIALGEHFFPSVLEAEGWPVPTARRRFSTDLHAADTNPLMWNTPPDGPFRYDPAGALTASLPLTDGRVAEKLSMVRPLTGMERAAVQALYFAPRTLLARFGFLFGNLPAATEVLLHAEDDQTRFGFFAAEFALFHRRCEVIAEHLAEHVGLAAEQRHGTISAAEAWLLLRTLAGDENAGTGPWEGDSGEPPTLSWPDRPTGGAFAALLGLLGTGLTAEFHTAPGDHLTWRDTTGSMSAFGAGRNHWNAPVPTVIPSLGLSLTEDQLRLAAVRNGFALRDVNGEPLFGAQPYEVSWTGTLLVSEAGRYRFAAGAPTEEGEEPSREGCPEHRWLVTLRRGQKTWQLLNRDWPDEPGPDFDSGSLELRRGAYQLTVRLAHDQPDFASAGDVEPRHTGFQLKYTGPDTEDELRTVPHHRLYRDVADAPLDAGLKLGAATGEYLRARYTSSLRDIRRTYQRAFKAALLVHRFRLSAEPLPGDPQSELGYLLEHPATFAGRTYYRTGPNSFTSHQAWFAPDLLPVDDPYHSPTAAEDQRSAPSRQRQAALFDSWERLFDYAALRAETAAARGRPAWRLFYEAAERQPDDPAELVRHLGIDVSHASQVLTYFDTPDDYSVQPPDLESEAWAIRAWRAECWLDQRVRCFHVRALDAARPHRWAADDPAATPDAGNENLSRFVLDGCLETGVPRRYDDVRALDDGLRRRGRDALVAWLCGMDRVPLPFAPGRFATAAADLSDLLLQDVLCGTAERASRVEDAISAVQAFVQRARLGLEPDFVVGPELAELWESRFASFREWQRCAERELYRENWIEWDELRRARRVEAFRMLEDRLREATLSVAVPGGLEWWPGRRPPVHPGLPTLQQAHWSELAILAPGPVPEDLDLLGTPWADGQPSWLAPISRSLHFQRPGKPADPGGSDQPGRPQPGRPEQPGQREQPGQPGQPEQPGQPPVGVIAEVANADNPQGHSTALDGAVLEGPGRRGDGNGKGDHGGHRQPPGPVEFPAADLQRLPLWLQAAVRLGHRYLRIAAAGVPPAAGAFRPCPDPAVDNCCVSCGCQHEPLVDEYYFWLQDGAEFDAIDQDADTGKTAEDETSDWHRPEKLPQLLTDATRRVVYLSWSRVRHGEFEPPRRSADPVVIDETLLAPGDLPQLDYAGRLGDSLRFEVRGGAVPIGYGDTTPPGFRYDLATDSALALPLVVQPNTLSSGSFPGDLDAYPYFAYVCPGAPVEPLSMFSVALTVAGALAANCRFEPALKWYELQRAPLTGDNAWTRCDRLPVPIEQGSPDRPRTEPGDVVLRSVRYRKGVDQPCCPTIAADDEQARQRAILLHYLETLLHWADALICRNNGEAFRRADVLLDVAGRILGREPKTVLAKNATSAEVPVPTLGDFQPNPARLNPRLMSIYQNLADRRTLVHRALNGRRRRIGADLGYFGEDGRVDGWSAGGCGCESVSECCCGCRPYRFKTLSDKAAELAAEVRLLGSSLLSAYEKGDAEYLAALRAAQERQLLELTIDVRENELRDADWQVQALYKSKENAQARLRYYQNLIADGLIAGEIGYESLTGVSMASRAAGNISEAIAQGIGISPDFWIGVAGIAGTPLQFNQLPLGSKLAGGFATAARILNALAEIASSGAGLSATEASWDRREQEWRHQVDIITIEIQQIERQILGAERRRDQASRGLDNAQRQVENSIAVQNFLRDKFTSHQLYLYLQRETAALYYQSFQLARQVAGQAERAFNYELGHTARSFLPDGAWDSLHEGLLAGERLGLAVRQMQQAYLDTNCREYELTKHISLRTSFPLQFLRLQAGGVAEIELPEWLFDLDYPGHYLRRVRNVSLTIPCVVGPYTGVHCRLTLLSSTTRVSPRLVEPPARCCDARCPTDRCGCSAGRDTGYRLAPEDARAVRAYAATEAIATSSGQNDSGLFELSFHDERYLPFEFAGAVSRWRIELPPETNFFDFDGLSDVVLHLNYTAREGGEALAAAAAEEARCRLPGDGLRLFDLRRDLPAAWSELRHTDEDCEPWSRRFDLALSSAMFPFVPGRRVVSVRALQLLVEAPCAEPGAVLVVRVFPGGHRHRPGSHGCDCERIDVVCTAGRDYPGLFRGELELRHGSLGPLHGNRPSCLATVEFPDSAGEICDVFLVAGYCTERSCGCAPETECGCRAPAIGR